MKKIRRVLILASVLSILVPLCACSKSSGTGASSGSAATGFTPVGVQCGSQACVQ